jgi:predicted metal-binding protein
MLPDELEPFIESAKALGGADAKIIPADSIVVADWTRLKCQYGCDGYGSSLTCPPNSPTPELTRKVISNYTWAILVQQLGGHDDDLTLTHDIAYKLEREIFLAGYHAAFGLAGGPCPYCKKCNLKACIHTDMARPAMESMGIDVYTTARNAGFEISVVTSHRDKPVYYALVLIS